MRKQSTFKWTKQTEEKLIRLVSELGTEWAYIQQLYYPHHKAYQLKNKYYYLMQQKMSQKQQNVDSSLKDESQGFDDIMQKLKELLAEGD